jgi:hypothetical protein
MAKEIFIKSILKTLVVLTVFILTLLFIFEDYENAEHTILGFVFIPDNLIY